MEQIIYLDGCETTIDNDGNAHVVGIIGDERFEIDIIDNAMRFSGVELHEQVEIILKSEGFQIKPKEKPQPKEKRKYTRHVTLAPASEYGKVTLKVVTSEPKTIVVYHLFIKGTDKFVYKLDEKGIYVTKGTKTAPMAFTQADIKCIRNINDFDLVKVVKTANYVKNKIAH